MENLLPVYSGVSDGKSLGFAAHFYRDLMNGEIDAAMEKMKAYFASIPYPDGGKDVLADLQKSECYYETILYVLLSMMNVATLLRWRVVGVGLMLWCLLLQPFSSSR